MFWVRNCCVIYISNVLKPALLVLECIDFVSDVGGVDQAPQDVVVEVAESQGDAA
ncbi:hypothetical protein [Corynebacterium diphtheriae]|uniref:hypothetical protein n=1 Tax=Corynebacterium diphtheriae TaxID=1717 RepID=UPI001F1197EE|nr:hypothetical protein [Corynebacterium diphtheriae]